MSPAALVVCAAADVDAARAAAFERSFDIVIVGWDYDFTAISSRNPSQLSMSMPIMGFTMEDAGDYSFRKPPARCRVDLYKQSSAAAFA
jgi:hypothetical protein